jgi:ectoine hydroxylase-related dioxygenase (phytanoyl-CoA dioxygenase family)
MFTLRIHLDACSSSKGPLRVIPGTHRHGVMQESQIAEFVREREFVECTTDLGGIVVMHPLALHASPKAEQPGHRRVLHVEYALTDLDGGLRWRDEV